MLSVGKVFGLLELQDNFTSKLLQASSRMEAFGNQTQKIGRNVAELGDRMTMGITLPIVAVGAASMKAAIDFESSFAGVRKTFDDTGLSAAQAEQQLAAMSVSIREMAKEMPLSVNEINKVAEAAGQLGVKRDDVLEFSKTMIMLGETTNLTADQAATSFARFSNIMGTPTSEVGQLGAALVDLGNKGASTEQEIIDMALRIAGAGKTIGLTEAQVLGMGNALSSLGIEAEMGGTAISKMMINIASQVELGGDKLGEFAKIAGMSAEEFAKAFRDNAGDAVAKFTEGLGRVQQNGGSLLGTLEDLDIKETRLRDTMLRIAGAGTLVAESMKTGTQAFAENSALTEEYNKRLQTAESQIKLFRNRVYDLGITLGGELVPHLLKILDALSPLIKLFEFAVKVFAALPGPVQTLSLALLGAAAAMGPVLSIGGRMLELFGMLSKALGFGAAKAAAGGGLTGLVAGFGAALSALVVPAAIGGIIYGFTKIWEAMKGVNEEWAKGRSGWGVLIKHDDNTWIRQKLGLNVNSPNIPKLPEAPKTASGVRMPALPSDWMTNPNAGVSSGPVAKAESYADQVAKWDAELKKPTVSLRLLSQALKDNAETTEQLSDRFGVSSEAIKLFESRQKLATKASEDHSRYLEQLNEQQEEYARTMRLRDFEQELSNQSMRAALRISQEQVPVLDMSKDAYDRLAASTSELGKTTVFSRETIEKMNREQERGSAIIAFATEKIELQDRALYDAAGAFANFGSRIGGAVGHVVEDVGALIQNFTALKKAQELMMSSGTASWGQYAAMATSWAGAIIGGLQMVVGWLERNDKYVTARINYISEAGGIFDLRNRALTVGASGLVNALQDASGKGIERAMSNLNRAMEEGEARLARYGLTWKDLSLTVRQSNIDQFARSLLADFRALGSNGVDAIGAMRGALSQLVIDAVDTGTKIPAALQPMIQDLILSGRLSEDAARALLGISETGVPSLESIKDAADRYGISLDALGPKVAQLQIDAAAKTIAADFELLIGLGGGAEEVLGKMQGAVQGVITKALTLGLTLPESMRPVIDRMIAAGLLTDEFGDKLVDTSRLNFVAPLADKIDDLISKLGELIDKFSEVDSAAEVIARRRRELLSGNADPNWQDPRESAQPTQNGPSSNNTGVAGNGSPRGGNVVTGDVYIDGQRAGRLLAPGVAAELALQGVV
jgi:TP901 family phage tail tape measure protein